jgi:hypothetical protein
VAGERLIDDYIAELHANLTVPRGVARRILAEAGDHLDEAAARFAARDAVARRVYQR